MANDNNAAAYMAQAQAAKEATNKVNQTFNDYKTKRKAYSDNAKNSSRNLESIKEAAKSTNPEQVAAENGGPLSPMEAYKRSC